MQSANPAFAAAIAPAACCGNAAPVVPAPSATVVSRPCSPAARAGPTTRRSRRFYASSSPSSFHGEGLRPERVLRHAHEQPPAPAPRGPSASAVAEPKPAAEIDETAVDALLRELDGSLVRARAADGTEVYILGTDHVSGASEEEVRRSFAAVRPDACVVELCGARSVLVLEGLASLERALAADPRAAPSAATPKLKSAIREPRFREAYLATMTQGARGALLSYFATSSAKAAAKFGASLGADMIAAAQEAALAGVPLVLGDRPQSVTDQMISRAASDALGGPLIAAAAAGVASLYLSNFDPAAVAVFGGVALALPALPYLFASAEAVFVTEEDLKESHRRALRGELEGGVTGAMEWEMLRSRDAFLSWSALRHPRLPKDRKRVLLVVGAAHVPGIKAALESGVVEWKGYPLRVDGERPPGPAAALPGEPGPGALLLASLAAQAEANAYKMLDALSSTIRERRAVGQGQGQGEGRADGAAADPEAAAGPQSESGPRGPTAA
eukprot:tig00000248_g21830.t1